MPKKKKEKQSPLIGAVMKWECADPLVESPTIINHGMTHRNPIRRLQLAKSSIRSDIIAACENPNLKWSIIAECVFQSPLDNKKYTKAKEMIYRGKLSEATPEYDKMQESLFRTNNMEHYVTCFMTAEILGTDSLKDSDFNERPFIQTRIWK